MCRPDSGADRRLLVCEWANGMEFAPQRLARYREDIRDIYPIHTIGGPIAMICHLCPSTALALNHGSWWPRFPGEPAGRARGTPCGQGIRGAGKTDPVPSEFEVNRICSTQV